MVVRVLVWLLVLPFKIVGLALLLPVWLIKIVLAGALGLVTVGLAIAGILAVVTVVLAIAVPILPVVLLVAIIGLAVRGSRHPSTAQSRARLAGS
jgi:hypothetical protein